MAMNKWLFGTIGFALTGTPIGALVGFFVGRMVDQMTAKQELPPAGGERQYDRTGRRTDQRQGTASDVALSMVVLTAAVMKADGSATRTELGLVREFYAKQFGPAHAAEMLRVLRDVLKRDIPLRQVCDQMRGHLSHAERLQVLHFLIGVARADGRIDADELRILQRIAMYLGVSDKDLDSMGAMFQRPAPSSAYTILEVKPEASDDEVRAAYRRMVKKHHPDKVAHLGEDMQRTATERFKKVQQAYERVQKERGMR